VRTLTTKTIESPLTNLIQNFTTSKIDKFFLFLLISSVLFLFVLVLRVSAWDANNKESLRDYAIYLAVHENLNVGEFLATIECESSFNKDAIGDSGNSYGLAQIHLPSHPYITKEQALNPFFALNWMSNEWSKGNAKIWSCWHTAGKEYLAMIR